MKSKAIKGLNLTTLTLSLVVFSAGVMSSADANAAQPLNMTVINQSNQVSNQGSINYKNFAYRRCYSRCWWERGIRRCVRSCY